MYALLLMTFLSVADAQVIQRGDILLGGGGGLSSGEDTASVVANVHRLINDNVSVGGGISYTKVSDYELGALILEGSYFVASEGRFVPVVSAGIGVLAGTGSTSTNYIALALGADYWLDDRVSVRPEIIQFLADGMQFDPELLVTFVIRFPGSEPAKKSNRRQRDYDLD
jgi:hypothetical protein